MGDRADKNTGGNYAMVCAKQVINYIQERYKIRELGVFGSYVRQEQTEANNVNVLVEFCETPSPLKFVNLENYLSDNLGVKVDLVHKASLKPLNGLKLSIIVNNYIQQLATFLL
jgi:uncharacterized protein